ncbi:MAG TPA: hypothetical protein ENH85_12590 [Candidatus Scalindua sp.]|nr:hypothetical protein [Candidatus Scalindua sp.]
MGYRVQIKDSDYPDAYEEQKAIFAPSRPMSSSFQAYLIRRGLMKKNGVFKFEKPAKELSLKKFLKAASKGR